MNHTNSFSSSDKEWVLREIRKWWPGGLDAFNDEMRTAVAKRLAVLQRQRERVRHTCVCAYRWGSRAISGSGSARINPAPSTAAARPAAAPPPGTTMVTVQCPAGSRAGDKIQVHHEGAAYDLRRHGPGGRRASLRARPSRWRCLSAGVMPDAKWCFCRLITRMDVTISVQYDDSPQSAHDLRQSGVRSSAASSAAQSSAQLATLCRNEEAPSLRVVPIAVALTAQRGRPRCSKTRAASRVGSR